MRGLVSPLPNEKHKTNLCPLFMKWEQLEQSQPATASDERGASHDSDDDAGFHQSDGKGLKERQRWRGAEKQRERGRESWRVLQKNILSSCPKVKICH